MPQTIQCCMRTLICCAPPVFFRCLLEFGAFLAGFVSAVLRITALSEHKVWIFAIAGVLLALSTYEKSELGNVAMFNSHLPDRIFLCVFEASSQFERKYTIVATWYNQKVFCWYKLNICTKSISCDDFSEFHFRI